MKNVKDIVYGAISGVVENTTDSYPSNFENLPAVQYIEDENSVYERTDNKEDKSYVRYIVDIWDRKVHPRPHWKLIKLFLLSVLCVHPAKMYRNRVD